MEEEILEAPGQVLLDNLVLISFKTGNYLQIQDYLVEMNIYESIFSPTVSGEIILTDSRNLIKDFALLGDEYLSVTVRTPTLSTERSISKIFRIYALEDKRYAKDGGTLLYKLSFASIESFHDLLNPIYRAFEGKPEEIVSNIYHQYLVAGRNIQISGEPEPPKNPLTILGETSNKIKFVSPGWTPVRCINWIASKSLPANGHPANYLFWETTKGFYFGNFEEIFRRSDQTVVGNYVYSLPKITTPTPEDLKTSQFMYNIKSLSVGKTFDQMRNLMSGYIANRLIDVNLYNKNFQNIDYDHGDNFRNYTHLDKDNPVPLFELNTSRNPAAYRDINFSYPHLHTDNTENFDVKNKFIWGNRRSNMVELNNFQMEVVIPGRTDIECGQLINITIPKKEPGALTDEDKVKNENDEMFSGNYLITNLVHKINVKSHYITMNVTKNSFPYKAVNQ